MNLPRFLQPFARGLGYFPAVRSRWIKGVLCIPVDTALGFALLEVIRRVLNGVTREGAPMPVSEALAWGGVFVVLFLVKGAAKYGMRWWITGASREFERIYRDDLFDHIVRLTPRDLAHIRTGDVMSRSVADIEAVRMLLGPSVMYVTQAALIVPTALTIMFLHDPLIAGVMLVPFSALALIVRMSAPATQRWSHEVQERMAELSVVAQENYSGIRVVKAFATEAMSGDVFRRMGRTFMEANVRLATIRGLTSAVIGGVKDVGILLVLGVGGWRLVQGRLQLGDVVQYWELVQYTMWPLIAIGWMLGLYTRARSGAERLDAIFEIEPSVGETPTPARLDEVRGELEVRGLTFGWNGVPVLQDVSFQVPAGKVLGITGRTGSGKTTLVQLLCRLVDPPPGTVFLDGHDIRELSFDTLRRALGVVPQDTFLFSESIAANIAFAGDHISDDVVESVAGIAQVDKDIAEFPEGYAQMLGERGVTLSGGQRQRTAIARTLAADPPVLILDDCLSAVDSVTEQAILAGLRKALTGRTAVIVSHRVAALSLADHVIVLDEGRVAEQGDHQGLVAMGGLYAGIAARQRIEQELETL